MDNKRPKSSKPSPNPSTSTSDSKNIGQFIMGEKLGEGTFGKVKKGTHILTGEKVAIKILEKSRILEKADKIRVEREIKILKMLKHKYIVELYSVIQTSTTIFLIMELSQGKELFDYIVKKKRLDEAEASQFFAQIISSVNYLHKLNICHRDLKPENLLLNGSEGIKLVDFGLSNLIANNQLLSTACGSPCYAAPEMLEGSRYEGCGVDIWSCGIILYAMICGYLPFEDKNNDALYAKIKEGKFAIPSFVSEPCKDLIKKILVTNPMKRVKISDIVKHPWFRMTNPGPTDGLIISQCIIPIDEEIIIKMEKYGFSKEESRVNVISNKHNQFTTTYYLLLKNKLKGGGKSVSDLKSDLFYSYIFDKRNQLSNYNDDMALVIKERNCSNPKITEYKAETAAIDVVSEELIKESAVLEPAPLPKDIDTKAKKKEKRPISHSNTMSIQTHTEKANAQLSLPQANLNLALNLSNSPANNKKQEDRYIKSSTTVAAPKKSNNQIPSVNFPLNIELANKKNSKMTPSANSNKVCETEPNKSVKQDSFIVDNSFNKIEFSILGAGLASKNSGKNLPLPELNSSRSKSKQIEDKSKKDYALPKSSINIKGYSKLQFNSVNEASKKDEDLKKIEEEKIEKAEALEERQTKKISKANQNDIGLDLPDLMLTKGIKSTDTKTNEISIKTENLKTGPIKEFKKLKTTVSTKSDRSNDFMKFKDSPLKKIDEKAKLNISNNDDSQNDSLEIIKTMNINNISTKQQNNNNRLGQSPISNYAENSDIELSPAPRQRPGSNAKNRSTNLNKNMATKEVIVERLETEFSNRKAKPAIDINSRINKFGRTAIASANKSRVASKLNSPIRSLKELHTSTAKKKVDLSLNFNQYSSKKTESSVSKGATRPVFVFDPTAERTKSAQKPTQTFNRLIQLTTGSLRTSQIGEFGNFKNFKNEPIKGNSTTNASTKIRDIKGKTLIPNKLKGNTSTDTKLRSGIHIDMAFSPKDTSFIFCREKQLLIDQLKSCLSKQLIAFVIRVSIAFIIVIRKTHQQ